MNDNDLDILLAIADGTLTGEAKQSGLERIAASPELTEELAAQLAAMDGLKALSPATMTTSERSQLRSNLISELHLEPAPVQAAAKQRRPWWKPVLGLASAAALLAAIVVVPSMLGTTSEEAADVVAIAPEATTVADSATEPVADGGDVDASARADAGTPTPTIVVPQVAEEDVQEFFASAPPPPPPADTPVPATSGDPETVEFEDEANGTGSDTITETIELSVGADPLAVDAGLVDECLDRLGDSLPGGEHIPAAATFEDDGSTIIHFGIDAGEGVVYSVSVDLDTCTITSLSP